MKIYFADDEKNIRDVVAMFLKSDGYDIIAFETGDKLFEAFKQSPCDLVLLDVMMPGTDGLGILTKLREISKVPVILLTAKDTESDHYSGLMLGSDDYIIKPFKPMILSAKIKALMRRIQLENKSKPDETTDEIRYGNLVCSDKKHEISVNGKPVNLTPTEMKFLLHMMKHFGEAVSKDEILDAVWGMASEIETRVTDETNRRIRKKLTSAGANVYVQTVWGYGFKMTEKEKAQ